MKTLPAEWQNSEGAERFWSGLETARRSVLMLDYDGTLAPFHNDRLEARPYAGVEERLAGLARLPVVRLVLVSGRPAGELRRMLSPEIFPAGKGIEIWGSHGREQIAADGVYRLLPLEKAQAQAVERMRKDLEAQGFAQCLECKPASLAIHWRGFDSTREERIRSLALSLYSKLPGAAGLELLPFDGGLELRSNDRTKGTVVEQILAQEEAGAPAAFLGDDLTDEDAFAAMDGRGTAILVRSSPHPTAAQYWIAPPQELLGFLDAWIRYSRAAARGA